LRIALAHLAGDIAPSEVTHRLNPACLCGESDVIYSVFFTGRSTHFLDHGPSDEEQHGWILCINLKIGECLCHPKTRALLVIMTWNLVIDLRKLDHVSCRANRQGLHSSEPAGSISSILRI
jgi:hypothetical protein